MKKYILKAVYFSLPIILFCLIIVAIDPYNLFNISKLIDDEAKYNMTNRSHEIKSKANMLWKAIEFKRDPCDKVIIGDSQGFHFREKLITDLTGEKIYNFCVPAASFETTTNIFWFATEQVELKKVYFQVSFALSNTKFSYNLFEYASDYLNKPYKYLFSKEILRDSYCNVGYKITENPIWVNDPYFVKPSSEIDSLSESWADVIFANYYYPEKYLDELKKIAGYCSQNKIELEFISMPCYQWVNDYIIDNGLAANQDKFFEDIQTCGNLHNYSELKNVNSNRNNFYDYFHSNQNIVDSLTIKIWGKETQAMAN